MRDGVAEIHKVLDELGDLLTERGQEYSGDSHTFWNFEEGASLASMTVEAIFLARLAEKIARVAAQVKGGSLDEGLLDTMRDIAGYAVLYLAYREYRGEE